MGKGSGRERLEFFRTSPSRFDSFESQLVEPTFVFLSKLPSGALGRNQETVSSKMERVAWPIRGCPSIWFPVEGAPELEWSAILCPSVLLIRRADGHRPVGAWRGDFQFPEFLRDPRRPDGVYFLQNLSKKRESEVLWLEFDSDPPEPPARSFAPLVWKFGKYKWYLPPRPDPSDRRIWFLTFDSKPKQNWSSSFAAARVDPLSSKGETLVEFEHVKPSCLPIGRWAITGFKRSLAVWDLLGSWQDPKPVARVPGAHRSGVGTMKVLPNACARLTALITSGKSERLVKLWTVEQAQESNARHGATTTLVLLRTFEYPGANLLKMSLHQDVAFVWRRFPKGFTSSSFSPTKFSELRFDANSIDWTFEDRYDKRQPRRSPTSLAECSRAKFIKYFLEAHPSTPLLDLFQSLGSVLE